MPEPELLAAVTEVAGIKVLPPCAIYEKVGQGGMGAVYRAWHLNLDIEVAVKVLKPRRAGEDPAYVERFWREGRSAARISHQNVVRVYDVGEHEGLQYIIMEFVAGETARQRVVRKGALAVAEAVQILYEAAQGLGEAHRQGLVHRDMKPDNLLIASAGQVKVADMGLAKPSFGSAEQSLMSSPDQIMGTPSYMPPEQWETSKVAAGADVWALGATLWFLLAGQDAITEPDGNTARIMRRILMQPFPDIRGVRSDVPDDVAALLARATAKDVRGRFLDAGEIAAAIERLPIRRIALRDGAGAAAEAVTLVSPPPTPRVDEIKRALREARRPDGRRPDPTPRTATVVVPMPAPAAAPVAVPAAMPSSAPAAVRRPPRAALLALAAAIVAGSGVYALWREPERQREVPTERGPQTPLPVPMLVFTASLEPVEPRIDGLAITTQPAIRVRVVLSEADTQLFAGDEQLAVSRDGEVVSCLVPVASEGRQTVTLTAKKPGCRDATAALDVVRLTRGPAVAIVAPPDGTCIDATSVPFEVVADEWTRRVDVVSGGAVVPLARDGGSDTWRGDVPLAPGANRFTVVATDLTGREGANVVASVVCTEPPAPVDVPAPAEPQPQPPAPLPSQPDVLAEPAHVATANDFAPPPAPDAVRIEPPTPVAKPALQQFPGCRSEPDGANDLGYPRLVTHDATGIELVAIGLRDGAKPVLYAARRMTTERQWVAGGGSATKTGVSGATIADWLQARGKGLALPRESDWELIRGCSELKQVDAGPIEWLQPARPSNRWPIRKDPSRADYKYTDSIGFGFRTMLRVS